MGNVYKNIDDDFELNPFQEFDKDDIINNSEHLPFNFDDEFKKSDVANTNIEENEKWLSDDDIKEFVKYGQEAKQAADLYSSLIEEPFESSVIKKKDAAKKKIISASDIEQILSYDEEQRKTQKFSDEYKTQKVSQLSQEDYLVQHFKDFIIAPKIAGKAAGLKHKNLIPQDYYKDEGTKVEIVDDPAMIAEEHRTQIEINRNKTGEIESILVTCKCGEKTFIQFDYVENDEDSATEYMSGMPPVVELDMTPRKRFNIDIPDSVIDDVIAEVEDIEEKKAKPFEGEVF